jgi:hypothetical protein
MQQEAAAFGQHDTVSHSLSNLKLLVSLLVNTDFQIIQYQILQILLYCVQKSSLYGTEVG